MDHHERKSLIRHRLLVAALALGTLGGFGSGFAHMAHRGCDRHERMRDMATRVCTDAIRDARTGEQSALPGELAEHRHGRRFAQEVRNICTESYRRATRSGVAETAPAPHPHHAHPHHAPPHQGQHHSRRGHAPPR